MTRLVTIAMAQLASDLGNVEENIVCAEKAIADAASCGADIVLLPELYFTGYHLQILRERLVGLCREYYGQIDESMSHAARDNRVYVIACFGTPNETGGICNSAVLYDRSGNRAGTYSKTFSFLDEVLFFSKGSRFPVFDTDFGRIGILICYDVGFPETARRLCLAGAEIIFIPAAWRIEDEHAWMLNIPSRALENQLFTVGVNHADSHGSLRLFGRSMICNPDGRIVMQLDYDKPMTGLCTINLDQVEEIRSKGGYFKDLPDSNAQKGFLTE
jgi:predicted amidohydrolase